MSQIIPAVIPESRHHLDTTLARIVHFSDEVQIDVVDGVFAPQTSWPYNSEESLEEVFQHLTFESVSVEFDLMIAHPEAVLDLYLQSKPARMIVHVESTDALEQVLEHAGTHGYQLGLAFNNDTDLSLLQTIDISCVDFVQLMGIAEIGAQGQLFDRRVLTRISEVKEMYPDMPVAIDGSVNRETISELKEAGADRFAVGSAIIAAEHPEEAYRTLLRQLDPISSSSRE